MAFIILQKKNSFLFNLKNGCAFEAFKVTSNSDQYIRSESFQLIDYIYIEASIISVSLVGEITKAFKPRNRFFSRLFQKVVTVFLIS